MRFLDRLIDRFVVWLTVKAVDSTLEYQRAQQRKDKP